MVMVCVGREAAADPRLERVIVIAPRREIVKQWALDFRRVTGRYMGKATGSDDDMTDAGTDVCATWAAVQTLQAPFQAVCRAFKTLVICDEHHHAVREELIYFELVINH